MTLLRVKEFIWNINMMVRDYKFIIRMDKLDCLVDRQMKKQNNFKICLSNYSNILRVNKYKMSYLIVR